MSDTPTPVTLPASLPFPIIISRLLLAPSQAISRGTPILEYTFTSSTTRRLLDSKTASDKEKEGARENDMVGTWESPIGGEVVRLESWLKPGSIAGRNQAGKTAMTVQQPCSHPVQVHGMCGVCGSDLTTDDYLSPPAVSRDTQSTAGPSRHRGGYEMGHDDSGLTVSSSEAQRIENQTREILLASRKLSLIVDLDQTIIHTTVDPTVGEWMREIHEQEKGYEEGETTTPTGSPSQEGVSRDSPKKKDKGKQKEVNPNAEALRDVAIFQLEDDLPAGYKPVRGRKVEGRTYYTKPRPGLNAFLERMSKTYEMHVYTMGTRTYADAICRIIDPDGRIFGGRILSRDESGSFSSKNLRRLFPTDTSMVVVIDDRADVWGDVPNLVKVIPYDFFLGIDDINATYLPKQKSRPASIPPRRTDSPSTTSDTDTSVGPTTPPEGSNAGDAADLIARSQALDEASEARPLAKLQESLENEEDSNEAAVQATTGIKPTGDESDSANGVTAVPNGLGDHSDTNNPDTSPPVPSSSTSPSPPPQPPAPALPPSSPRPNKPLLNANDYELDRIERILEEIHSTFYGLYDASAPSRPLACDVEVIIPEIKSRLFRGCRFIFSGVVPVGVKPESSEIHQKAILHGARVSQTVEPSLTHCLTANDTTMKTHEAHRTGLKVLWVDWFWKCVERWERVKEEDWVVAPDRVGVGNGEAGYGPAKEGVALVGHSATEGNGNVNGSSQLESTETISTGEVDESEEIELQTHGDDIADDDLLQDGMFDDDLQAEMDALIDGDGDGSSVVDGAEDVVSVSSPPGTPRKRVRYADEESLPLESYKDPSPTHSSDPPRKRRKALLLEDRKDDDEVPEGNRWVYKDQGKGKGKAVEAVEGEHGSDEEGVEAEYGDDDRSGLIASFEGSVGGDGDGEGDDLFAQMLMDSMGGGDEGG